MTGQVMAGETSGDKEEMMDQDRSPIWTIPRGEITAFFAFFTTLMIAGFSFVGFHEYYANQSQGIFSIIRKVIANAGSVTAGSAGIAIVASETTRWMMVIASYFRDKFLEPQRERYRNQGREQGHQEGLEKGRQEMANRWREWNQRNLDALEKGEEFNEPPPGEE